MHSTTTNGVHIVNLKSITNSTNHQSIYIRGRSGFQGGDAMMGLFSGTKIYHHASGKNFAACFNLTRVVYLLFIIIWNFIIIYPFIFTFKRLFDYYTENEKYEFRHRPCLFGEMIWIISEIVSRPRPE